MKAIVYKGIKKVDVENVEDPKIEKDDTWFMEWFLICLMDLD